jgi:hypothetical protein
MNPKNKHVEDPTSSSLKSKYEFNMAEFPFCLISSSNKIDKSQIASITYEDTIIGKNEQVIPRKWEVSPSRKEGWGSLQVLGLVVELIKIAKEKDFVSPVICFESIYNLIKRLGLKNSTEVYKRIRHDLDALVGYTFKAKNAFWDNEKKAYVDMTGHFFEDVKYYQRESDGIEKPLPFAMIKISEMIWVSIKSNALITVDTGDIPFHSFTPTEQRLCLYLTKMLHTSNRHIRDVVLLGKQIPLLTKNYKTTKNQITVACKGLIKKGFPLLSSYYYEKNVNGDGENIIFIKASKQSKTTQDTDNKELNNNKIIQVKHQDLKKADLFTNKDGQGTDYLTEDILKVCGDPKSSRAYSIIASKLPTESIYRILSEIRQEYPGTFKGSRGSLFIVKAKQEASRLDISLGFNLS